MRILTVLILVLMCTTTASAASGELFRSLKLHGFEAVRAKGQLLVHVSTDDILDYELDELNEQGESWLQELAEVLANAESPERIIVEGHTDSWGEITTNYALSLSRASIFADALSQALGDKDIEITPVGFGEAIPRLSNNHLYGRSGNRRLTLVFER